MTMPRFYRITRRNQSCDTATRCAMAVFDLILKGGCVVQSRWRGHPRYRRARRRHPPKSAISRRASAERVVDCTGLHILPGVIDSQVHFREPGLDHKEDLETGARAGRDGAGVTSVLRDAQYQSPDDDTGSAGRQDRPRDEPHALRFRLSGSGGTHENAKDIPELGAPAGAPWASRSFMGSSTGSLLVEDDGGVTGNSETHPAGVRPSIRKTRKMPCANASPFAWRAIRVRIPVWRSAGSRPEMHRAAGPHRPCDGRKGSMCCISRRRRRWIFSSITRTSPPSR